MCVYVSVCVCVCVCVCARARVHAHIIDNMCTGVSFLGNVFLVHFEMIFHFNIAENILKMSQFSRAVFNFFPLIV